MEWVCQDLCRIFFGMGYRGQTSQPARENSSDLDPPLLGGRVSGHTRISQCAVNSYEVSRQLLLQLAFSEAVDRRVYAFSPPASRLRSLLPLFFRVARACFGAGVESRKQIPASVSLEQMGERIWLVSPRLAAIMTGSRSLPPRNHEFTDG